MAEDLEELNYMNNDLSSKKEDRYPGNIKSVQGTGNQRFVHFDNDVVLMIHFLQNKMIRFRYAPEGDFPNDFSYGIDEKFNANDVQVDYTDDEDYAIFTTADITLSLEKIGGKKRIINRAGVTILEDEKGFHWEDNRAHGGEIVMNSMKLQSGEHYFGLGDKSCNLDLRGKRFTNWGSDTYGYGADTDPLYKNIPFFIGLHHKIAYGLFFDNSFQSFFDFGHERSNVTSFWAHGGEMNYYFIYGPSQKEVTEKYVELTGKPELPPLWALGFHQCKWSYYPESKVKEITKGFRDREIPCDAIYLDIDYMDGFRCFTWSPDYFPEPKRMVKELAEDGFKTIVIIDPGIKIDKDYWVYQQGKENDYFCRRADGPLMKGTVWPGLCNFPDYTKSEVRDWWADLFKGLIAEDGIKGVWNDMNEPAVFEEGTFPDDVRFHYEGNECSHRKAHNIYGMQMARATYMGLKKYMYPNRPFVITRSGYSGVQRYTSGWTGDNVASWEHLKIANRQCQRLSISGMSFMGSDIGGFIETPSAELFVRWVQLGVFHPFFRIHSSGDHGDQEPWSFTDAATRHVKKFIELRYKLLPYIYTTFWQYVERGTPMLRPLSFLDQKDPETCHRNDEFGFGDNLIICPIAEKDQDGTWMYLPKGEWFYWWTDERVDGGQEAWASANLDRIPIYVKAGAVIPEYPVMQYVGEKEVETLKLNIYHVNGKTTSEIYEDAGDGYGYEEDDKSLLTFLVKGDKTSLTIELNKAGNFESSYKDFNIEIKGMLATKCTIDGEEASFKTNSHSLQLKSVKKDFKEIKFEL